MLSCRKSTATCRMARQPLLVSRLALRRRLRRRPQLIRPPSPRQRPLRHLRCQLRRRRQCAAASLAPAALSRAQTPTNSRGAIARSAAKSKNGGLCFDRPLHSCSLVTSGLITTGRTPMPTTSAIWRRSQTQTKAWMGNSTSRLCGRKDLAKTCRSGSSRRIP